MMILKQDINLYQQERELVPFLSFTRMLQLWAVLFLGLALYAIEQKWEVKNKVKQLDALKLQQKEVDVQLKSLSDEIKLNKSMNQVQNGVKNLKEQITKVQNTIAFLQKEESKSRFPLSVYLEGFAKRHVKGTYVSHFYMENMGTKMLFEGMALQPQLVPLMIQSWKASPAMVGKGFKQVKMQRIKENNSFVQFNLQAE